MPRVDIEIDSVKCDECGTDLAVEADKSGSLTITPCPFCLDAAHEAGYEKGYNEGKEEEE